jgi:uncharacterized protein (TIGR00255 family)
MTGFGQIVKETKRLLVKVEVKSLNSKNTDTGIRLPKPFLDKEIEVRNHVNTVLERGKINVNIDVQFKEQSAPKSFNKSLIKSYFLELKELGAELGTLTDADIFRQTMKLPDILFNEIELENTQQQDWNFIMEVVKEATEQCDTYRKEEGAVLQEKLYEYIQNIKRLSAQVMELDGQRIKGIRSKLWERLKDLSAKEDQKFDDNRFEQELIYYIEKLDISEEKVRLDSHLNYFIQTMESDMSNGKKLGFISQEIGREINTIGSKVSDAQIQRIVVEMKDELEKIKEQCLNIL